MKSILIILLLLFLVGCTNSYIDINPQEYKKMIEEDVFVIDVHVPEQEHIEGTDAVIAFNEIKDNLDKLPSDKDSKIIVYCRSGSMSREASQTLIDLGYKNVFNLVGGRNVYIGGFG